MDRQHVIDRLWPDRPKSIRELVDLVSPGLAFALRLTAAAVAAFLCTRLYTGGSIDLTGSLSAMLVTQATISSSFRYGMLRVGAVLLGGTLAVVIAELAGLNSWSLALAVFLALIGARLLKLGTATIEVAISAMLILQSASSVLVGQPVVPAFQRIVMTLIGSLVGLVIMLLFPPRIPTKLAASQVRGCALAQRRSLQQAAAYLFIKPVTKAAARQWLEASRDIIGQISRASSTLNRVSAVRKWNSRAIGVANIEPILRSGLDTLERCLLAIRSLFLVMEWEAPVKECVDDGYGSDTRTQLASTFAAMGAAIAAFGDIVQAEASGYLGDTEEDFRARLVTLREQREALTDVLVADPEDVRRWLLRGSILSVVDQVLEHLDLQARTRLRERWELSQAGLRLPEGQVGPSMDSSSRRWIARGHAAAAHKASTAQADFLSDVERTQPLPIVRLDSQNSATERLDQMLALGELAYSDRTGRFVAPNKDVVSKSQESEQNKVPAGLSRKTKKRWWRIRL